MEIEDWLGKDNKIGIDIFESKYRYNKETFEDWLNRISNGNEAVKKLILEKKFLFGGRILSNRGLQDKGKKVTYSNCFVLPPPEDNLESIFETTKKMARIYANGGGAGLSLGKLRPNGSKVNNNAETSTGVAPFMDMYSKVTETIGARGRRGALILILPSNHPDIEEFIKSKLDLTKVVKANISIWADDAFMKAVVEDSDYELYFKVEQTGEVITKTIRAKELMKMIAESNHRTGEPGILFVDRIKKYNLMQYAKDFEITGVNPCGH